MTNLGHRDMETLHITVIGLGRVGSSLANLFLAHPGHRLVINIMDPGDWVVGAWLDTAHAAAAFPQHEVFLNSVELFNQADFVFYTAGANSKHGSSRNSVAEENIRLTRQIFSGTNFQKLPYVICITNPVDHISWHAWKASGLPVEQVIGTGTLLDSQRLGFFLAREFKVPVPQVNSWVLGEHGEDMVAIFSRTTLAGRPLLDQVDDEVQLARVFESTQGAAFEIRETQPATRWGVSASAYRIFQGLISEEPIRVPVSVKPDAHYVELLGHANLFISLPVELSRAGVRQIEDFEMNADEWRSLRKAASVLAEFIG